MKRQIFIPILILLGLLSNAQSILPPSPSGAGLVRNVSTPVNLYTGIPQIGVPLVAVPHPNGASIPVGLSYHAGGHKVQDVAGPVGLGWSLQAGGMITRVVKGLPDKEDNYYTGNESREGISNGVIDGEHDIFFYSLPSGAGGQFVLDKNGVTAYPTPYSDIRILKSGTLEDGYWTITDVSGVVYTFGETTTSRETTEYISMNSEEVYDVNEKVSYVSTWNLNKVRFPNHTQEVTFDYVSYSSYSYEYYSATYNVEWVNCYNSTVNNYHINETGSVKNNTKITILNPKYLYTITTGLAKVTFTWGLTRTDLPNARGLTEVKQTYDGVQTARFKLNYFYFSSANSPYDEYNKYSEVFTCTPETCYRLGLGSIDIYEGTVTKKYREFTYIEPKLSGGSGQDHDLHALPPRFSANQDHWGFASGQGNASWDISGHLRFPRTSFSGIGVICNGVYKTSHAEITKSNIIKSIKDMDGGITEYEFEVNQLNSVNVGGLRVKSICRKTGTESICTSYEYISGNYFADPIYHYTYYFDGNDLRIINGQTLPSGCNTFYTLINSESFNHLFDVNGSHIGYTKVKELNSNGGFSVYEYFGMNDNADVLPSISFIKDESLIQSLIPDGKIIFDEKVSPPFPSNTSYFWKRGLPKSVQIFKAENTTTPISKEDYDYYFNLTSKATLTNETVIGFTEDSQYYKFRPLAGGLRNIIGWIKKKVSDPPKWYLVGNYSIKVTPIQFYKRVSTINDEFGETSSTTNWDHYKTGVNFPDYSITEYKDGSQSKVAYKYAFDLWPSAPGGSATGEAFAYWQMKSQNMIGVPVQTINLYKSSGITNFSVLSSNFTTYLQESTNIVPYHTYTLELPDPIVESQFSSISIDQTVSPAELKYDDTKFSLTGTLKFLSSGNIWYKINQDVRTDYTWGYNNSLVTQTSTNGFTTSYVHIPLVGVSTITDPNGRVTKYEYDEFNRLRMVRDHEDNIVERYRYHYASESDPALSSNISVSGTQQIGITQVFTSTHALSFYGKTRYIWDFGNGVTRETTTNSTTYAYPANGFYRVSVTLLNPEYAEPFQDVVYRTIGPIEE